MPCLWKLDGRLSRTRFGPSDRHGEADKQGLNEIEQIHDDIYLPPRHERRAPTLERWMLCKMSRAALRFSIACIGDLPSFRCLSIFAIVIGRALFLVARFLPITRR